MTDIVDKARARAAAMIEKAERERDLRIWASERTDFELRTAVIQKDADWLNFSVTGLRDILTLFDSFEFIPVAEYKGQYRGATYADNPKYTEEEIRGYHYAVFKASGRCPDYMSGSQDVTVYTYADGLDDRPVRIGVDLSTHYWSDPRAPSGWVPTFGYKPPRFREPGEWQAYSPSAWGGLPSWCYSTGAPRPGMAYEGLCMLDHRDTLEQEIDRALSERK